MNANSYVEQRGEGWYIKGSRVSVDSVVYSFLDGVSPESISRECFPVLSLEEVYGAVSFYLGNRKEFDAYLVESEVKADAWWNSFETANPQFREKVAKSRGATESIG